ncbi:MAG: multicopper oxidase family protein [Gemmatimonadota bacterium]
MLDRRRFLAASGLGTVLASCRTAPAPLAVAQGQRVDASSVRRLIVERHDAIQGRCRYVADLGTRLVAQPILVARRGGQFEAEIVNRLPQPTTVHFHGLVAPEAQDGAGFVVIAPGDSKAVRFRIHNRAGLYWFHSHVQGLTAEQVHAGLAGLFVVTDEEDAALDAALALAPANRLALAAADVRAQGQQLFPYAPTAADCVTGWLGNRALINSHLDASFEVASGWVRVQLLNACNARGLLLSFQGDRRLPFYLLGTDGGLLASPVEVDRVFVHPAERIDVAVDVSGQRAVSAISQEFDPRMQIQADAPQMRHPIRERYAPLAAVEICRSDAGGAVVTPLPDGTPLPLFSLHVGAQTRTEAPKMPARLSALPDAAAPTDAHMRRFRLDFIDRTGFVIDGAPYRIDEIAFRVPRGTREVWEIKNSPISMPHPMHLHGEGFRVLRRQGTYGPARVLATAGNGRLPTDLGVKDTVVVWPNETVWVAVGFSLPPTAEFAGPQRYMFHCHNLEHEDGMMMRNYAIV